MATENTASFTTKITTLLQSRDHFLWVISREEVRAERALIAAAAAARYPMRCWDVATGITDPVGNVVQDIRGSVEALDFIRQTPERYVYVLRDFHAWKDPVTVRSLKSLARYLSGLQDPKEFRSIIVLSPSNDIAPDLTTVKVVELPIPTRDEMATILDTATDRISNEEIKTNVKAALVNGTREAAIDAVLGLTSDEAAACYATSLVATRTIDPKVVAKEKKAVITREGLVTWIEPDPMGLEALAGAEVLKPWLRTSRLGFSKAARDYGLPPPKGVFLAGVPGGGKSLTAKAYAGELGYPLLGLDMGALRSKYVGESEARIRRSFKVIEATAPVVVLVDEVEKALAGSTGAQGDGGVSSDALGALLTWRQECTAPVFMVFTANDVRGLPPELMRKGRVDEVFWIDLPTVKERAAVLTVTLKKFGRDPSTFDLMTIARATTGFTGAELAALIPDALKIGFADNARPITTADLLAASKGVVPLSKTAAEKINALREWAKGRARPASLPEDTASTLQAGVLDLS